MSTSPIRVIDVQKQHSMSFRETWHLCLSGVKHRLFRSLLTLAVVILAVAFFMFLLSESMFQRAVAKGVSAEDMYSRFTQNTLTHILSPATDMVSVNRLATAQTLLNEEETYEQGLAIINEAIAVSGLDKAQLAYLTKHAFSEVLYTEWIKGLPTGHRINLVGKNQGRAAFKYILENQDEFFKLLAVKVEIRVPQETEGLREFLKDFAEYKDAVSEFTRSWNASVKKANDLTLVAKENQMALSETRWLPATDSATLEKWCAELNALGFRLTMDDIRLMCEQSTQANENIDLQNLLNQSEFRKEWRKLFAEKKITTAEEKMPLITDKRAARLFEGQFDRETLERCKTRFEVNMRLMELDRILAPVMRSDPVFLGLTGRQIFLLCISFMVCMVGIANAMLMSITERYREIATMKCLGATDTYILSQFMLEAALQGFMGGIVGVIVGFIISVARCAILYGSHLFTYFPMQDVVFCAVFSLATGIILAALASTQPSWSASRMAPMEAMRVE